MSISVQQLQNSRIIVMTFHDIVKPEDKKAAFKELDKLLAKMSKSVGLIVDQSNYTPDSVTQIPDSGQPVSIMGINNVEEFNGSKIIITVIIPHNLIVQSIKQQFEVFKSMNPTDFENTDIADNLAEAQDIINRVLENNS